MKLLKKIKIKELVTYNFWLKIISLIIAIIIWLYVSGEITKGIKI
jgi:YbbR domain-containing protein